MLAMDYRTITRLLLLFILGMLSACDSRHMNEAERGLLPTEQELAYICSQANADDLKVEVNRIPYLQTTYSMDFGERLPCRISFQLELSDNYFSYMSAGNDVGSNLFGATVGLKAAGLEIKKPEAVDEGLHGHYLQAFDEGKYMGLVYASAWKDKSMMLFVFGIPQRGEQDILSFIRSMEQRYYVPEAETEI